MLNEKTIYTPEFIPYYASEINKLWLSYLEWLAYWFIRNYAKHNKFFFSSEDFANIINSTPATIDNIVSKLKKMWIIETETRRFNIWWTIKSYREIKFLSSLVNEDTISLYNEDTISLVNEIKNNNKNNKENSEHTFSVCEKNKDLSKLKEYKQSDSKLKKDNSEAEISKWKEIKKENAETCERLYESFSKRTKQKRHNKKLALQRISSLLKIYSKEELQIAIEEYFKEKKETIQKNEWNFVKTCENFFWYEKWTKVEFCAKYIIEVKEKITETKKVDNSFWWEDKFNFDL